MPRPDNVDHVEIARFDHTIEMRVDEIEAGRRTPMTEELDVLAREPLPEQGFGQQVYLTDRKVIRRAPPRVDEAQLFRRPREPLPYEDRMGAHGFAGPLRPCRAPAIAGYGARS